MEPARSDCLVPGHSCILTNSFGRSNKAFFQVKLTDSLLTALEEFQAAKCTDKRLRISFTTESAGAIDLKVGRGDDARQYSFTVSTLDQQGSVQCVLDQRSRNQLSTLGSVSHKMMICGTDDSYAKTKKTMVEARNEKEKAKTKEIKLNQEGKPKKQAQLRKPGFMANRRNGSILKPRTKPGVVNKSLRSRIIHMLALKPHKKLELDSKLGKDVKGGSKSLMSTLSQVADFKDNKYHLKKFLYAELEIDTWPLYSQHERQLIRRIIPNVEKSLVANATSLTAVQPQETRVPSSGLVLSTPSPFKAVAPHQKWLKETEQTESSDQETTKQASAVVAPFRKRGRGSAPGHFASNHVKRVKVNGLDSSGPSNTSTNSVSSMKATKSGYESECSHSSHMATEQATGRQSRCSQNEMSTSVPDESIPVDYQRHYTKITSEEMRSRYKTDFNAEYPKYQELQKLLDPFQNKVKKLAEELKTLEQDSPQYCKVQKKMERACDKWENDEKLQKVQQERDALYDKLSYIKQLVVQYDHEQLLAEQNSCGSSN